jgi:two-component system nitrogen regulation response regulator GlnG
MPAEAQTRLLRVLQEGEFTTVGGRQPVKANVRIVAATHRDLRQSIRQGLFREDLFYRLNVVPLRLPPLRERAEDIPLLARHFLDRARAAGLAQKHLDPEALERLKAHRWPGNARELENLMRRLAALYPQERIGADAVAGELAESEPVGGGAPGQEPETLSAPSSRRTATARRCATSTTGCWPRWSGRCCASCCRRPGATRSRRPPCWA